MPRLRLTLRLITLLFAASSAIAGPEVPSDCLGRLRAAVLSHDTIYENARIPSRMALTVRKNQSRQYFDIYARYWREQFHPPTLANLLRGYRDSGILSEPDQQRLKEVRAALKSLRGAFIAFDERHVSPASVNRLAVVLGHFQDEYKNGHGPEAQREAERALRLITAKKLALLDQQIEDYVPGGRESFDRWASRQIGHLKSELAKPAITQKRFHELRKIISNLVVVYDVLLALGPSSGDLAVRKALSTLNGKMGAIHDGMVAEKLQQQRAQAALPAAEQETEEEEALDYISKPYLIPPEVRPLLEQLAKRFDTLLSSR